MRKEAAKAGRTIHFWFIKGKRVWVGESGESPAWVKWEEAAQRSTQLDGRGGEKMEPREPGRQTRCPCPGFFGKQQIQNRVEPAAVATARLLCVGG
jgi:hypothetical protein